MSCDHFCHVIMHSTLTNTIPHKKQTIQINTPLSFMITTSDKGSKYNSEQLFIAGNWGEAFLKLESILGGSVMAYTKNAIFLKEKKKSNLNMWTQCYFHFGKQPRGWKYYCRVGKVLLGKGGLNALWLEGLLLVGFSIFKGGRS